MKITAYECPDCGSIYKTAAKAGACKRNHNKQNAIDDARKAAHEERDVLRNYVRNNATSISEIETMLVEKTAELFKTDYKLASVKLDVKLISDYKCGHTHPIGSDPKNFKSDAFVGKIKLEFKKPPDGFVAHIFGAFTGNGSAGFHTGGGGYRGKERGSSTHSYEYAFHFFVEDFPHLKKRVIEFRHDTEKYSSMLNTLQDQLYEEIKYDTYLIDQDTAISILRDEIERLNKDVISRIEDKRSYATEKYYNEKQKQLADQLKKCDYGFNTNILYRKLILGVT